jgi:pimeloyl-[acyl-carrier protein] methyl ester esterase
MSLISIKTKSPMVALVLLPGLDGTASLFAEFAAALGSDIKIIPVSYPTDIPLGYAELEQVARAALPSHIPFVLLGESFSGPIAIAIAASAPVGLLGLVLCCSFARNPLPVLAAIQPLVRILPVRAALLALLNFFILGRFSSASLRIRISRALSQVAPQVLKARALAVLSIDVTVQLRRVAVPILYLRASEDRMVPRSSSALISSLAPATKIVELVAPHFLLQAVPAVAATVVSEFVTQVSSVSNTLFNTDRYGLREVPPPVPVG